MNLKSFLSKPADLKPDFGWWFDAEGFDPEKESRNPHECKDELDMQWGGKGFVIGSVPVIARKASKPDTTREIVRLARTMMNSGMREQDIREKLGKSQNPEIMNAAKDKLDDQLRLCGSVGRFILDARGYKNCREAMASASRNPFKKYIRYIIGCNCANPAVEKTKKASPIVSSGNPVEDALNSEPEYKEQETEYCPETGLEYISGQGDIDKDWAGNTMIDVMNACDLDDGKAFTASAQQPYIALKRFFIALDSGEIPHKEEDVLDMDAENDFVVPDNSIILEDDEDTASAIQAPVQEAVAGSLPLEFTVGGDSPESPEIAF